MISVNRAPSDLLLRCQKTICHAFAQVRLPRCPNSDLALCQGPLWTILSGRHGLVAIVDFATIRASDLGIMLGHVSEESGEGLATVFAYHISLLVAHGLWRSGARAISCRLIRLRQYRSVLPCHIRLLSGSACRVFARFRFTARSHRLPGTNPHKCLE